jgi:hypothetical protein
LVGSTATLKVMTLSGTPVARCQLRPPSVVRKTPRPANVPPPPNTLSPVETITVPPSAGE